MEDFPTFLHSGSSANSGSPEGGVAGVSGEGGKHGEGIVAGEAGVEGVGGIAGAGGGAWTAGVEPWLRALPPSTGGHGCWFISQLWQITTTSSSTSASSETSLVFLLFHVIESPTQLFQFKFSDQNSSSMELVYDFFAKRDPPPKILLEKYAV